MREWKIPLKIFRIDNFARNAFNLLNFNMNSSSSLNDSVLLEAAYNFDDDKSTIIDTDFLMLIGIDNGFENFGKFGELMNS